MSYHPRTQPVVSGGGGGKLKRKTVAHCTSGLPREVHRRVRIVESNLKIGFNNDDDDDTANSRIYRAAKLRRRRAHRHRRTSDAY